MTKEEATKVAEEINELIGEELYDILEGKWIRLLKANPVKRKSPFKNYYVSIDLEPLEQDALINVSYDYFKKHIKVNKLV